MASALARAYKGSLGQSPQRGLGAEPLVRALMGPGGGKAPLKSKHFWLLDFSVEAANLPTFI